MNSFAKNLLVWVTIMLVMIVLFNLFNQPQTSQLKLSYTDFLSRVDEGEVLQVKIQGQKISGVMVGDKRFVTFNPDDPALVQHLLKNKIEVVAEPEEEAPWYMTLFISWFPMLLLVGVWIFFMRQMQGGGGGRGGAMSFGRSRARMINEETARVTFEDVAGVDEAKEELSEVVQFLSEPKKFTRLGGRIPKGVLLVGPPGTGKTLLARAVAGEAGVPFFSISGSDFVEMFVGVGASRVRDLFSQGKKNAPCLIFIDEIDAVGRQRGAGLGGGHDEREQTLNQLLVEMDGFESNEGVILIAATNRPDVLDPALLRPGRFDRQVVVPTPDVQGRAHILKVHTRKTPLAGEIDLDVIARGTPGFSGADLENLVNEAALYAAKNNQDYVKMVDFEEAKDKVLMGRERRSLILTDEEKKTTAYHEAGHALIAKLLDNCDPVHKVTIIPRGRALGVTQQLPVDDRHNYNKAYLEDTLVMLLGGRVAEELILDQVTTGASNDIERATKMARSMVCQWGMSEKLGPMTFGESQDQVFLGKELVQHKDFSEDTSRLIDSEVRRIIDTAYETANRLLSENEDMLHKVSDALLDRETISGDDIDTLMEGGELAPVETVAQTKPSSPARAYGSAGKSGYTPVSESGKEGDADKGDFSFDEQPEEKEEFKLSEESEETEVKEEKIEEAKAEEPKASEDKKNSE
ncbi:ATP-dependent zinc metalloprotease FtsH [Maridesulfovibrio salexigens]|uniref:ATP-dependent zinc metalloprotease FtsH n=1 Tax=Maridesulfovibrio salexigens (strain ATCC 14822 / DSM 2638 / NCIMB 8403 / VKM B-1763) TaxID=526222 RepID=C6BTS5_MARSD|nr:ATP-dependent zinc metalloprotease FtsH [Maridesulfovibrio salexigens]ACS79855.1 ATP-dependent metalloprotease FtsH [Maridesulfovibrio salexigens DSM 2638]